MTTRRARDDGGVRRRPDGRWEGSISLGWENGRRKRKFFYATTKAEAGRKVRRAQSLIDAGRPLLNERTTVGTFLDQWLKEVIKPKLTYDTWRGYRNNVELHLKPALGSVRLIRLTPVDVERMLNELRSRRFSPRSIQYVHATLRSALGTAERWELVHRNVAKLVSAPTPYRTHVAPFTPTEIESFLTAAREHRLGALFTVALALGLRPEEAMGLAWENVDLDSDHPGIRVSQVLKREGGSPILRQYPKTAASKRTIALPNICVQALRTHRRRQNEERLRAVAWQDFGLVFTSRLGTPLEHRGLSRVFDSLLERAGLPHRRLYDLRHTSASILLAQGVQPRVLQDILGHSSYRLTMDTYAHVMAPAMRDAAAAMDRALGKGE
jgi:integrase